MTNKKSPKLGGFKYSLEQVLKLQIVINIGNINNRKERKPEAYISYGEGLRNENNEVGGVSGPALAR